MMLTIRQQRRLLIARTIAEYGPLTAPELASRLGLTLSVVFHAIYRKRKYGPERKFFTHNDAELHANERRFVLTEHGKAAVRALKAGVA
jgi:DNA-binding MarR family transcriptional regulator